MVIDVPFFDAFRFDPSPTWRRLQIDDPIVRARTLAGSTVWLITRYADVRMVLADQRFSRAATVGPGAPRVAVASPLAGTLPTTDPPEHTRLRTLVSGAFSRRRIEEYRPWVTELAERLADDVEAAEQPADLRALFALPLPIQVICHLLGVPYADRHDFREWTELAYSMSMADADRVEAAMRSLLDYLAALVADKVAARARGVEPADLLDELLLARDGVDRLSADELVAFGLNLLVAGHETSANQLAGFVATLLRDPARWRRLVAEPALVEPAVEELLRVTRLSEVGQLRVATVDVVIAGVTVRAGDAVMAAIGAANRDPAVFAEPDAVDLGRVANPHLAFGLGPHFCLGAHLARVELQESLAVLTRRFPDLRLAVPAEELAWRKVLISGLAELPVHIGSPGDHA